MFTACVRNGTWILQEHRTDLYGGGKNSGHIRWMCHKHRFYRDAKMPQICGSGKWAQKGAFMWKVGQDRDKIVHTLTNVEGPLL